MFNLEKQKTAALFANIALLIDPVLVYA